MSDYQTVHRNNAAFFGRVAAEWIDHRNMVLMESFVYRDSEGEVWHVPESAEINGASIPRYLWSVVGSPFVGRYRHASVVHDYHCQQKAKPAKDVHRMFYDACITEGVHPMKARLMHKAVAWFGPRWKEPTPSKH